MKKRDQALDNFLRDMDRVGRLGELFTPKRRAPTQTLKEVAPGVFKSVDEPPEPSVFGKLRESLEGLGRADGVARDLGRKIRKQVR